MQALRRSLHQYATAVFRIDLRALAVLRIALASIILADLLNRAQFLVAHYTKEGVVPHGLSSEGWPLSLHLISDALPYQAALFVLAAVFALMMLVGYKTRVATFVSWFLLLSLHAGNPLVLHRADTELRLLMFFAMFVPLSATWALDAVRKHTATLSIASLGTAALLLQVGFLYLFAGLQKSGVEWRDGSAISFTLSAEHYSTDFGRLFVQFPDLLSILTYAIIALQLASFFLVFSPRFTATTRMIATTLLILMQVAFLFTLKLGLFPYISIAGLLIFLPKSFWDTVARAVRRARRMILRTV